MAANGRGLAVFLILLSGIIISGARLRHHPDVTPEDRALLLFDSSLAARALLDDDTEHRLLLAALEADPANPAAWSALHRWSSARPPSLEQGLRRIRDRHAGARPCFAVIENALLLRLKPPATPAVRCTVLQDLSLWHLNGRADHLDSLLRFTARTRSPEIINGLWQIAAIEPWTRPRLLAAVASLAEAGPAITRMTAAAVRAGILHLQDEHASAGAIEQELRREALAGPPGLLEAYATAATFHATLRATDSLTQAHNDFEERQSADDLSRLAARETTARRFNAGYYQLMWLFHRGRLREALHQATRLVHLADSLGSPVLRARVLARRGQIHLKVGRPEAAERDLLAALVLPAGDAEDWAVDGHHNLLHLYEMQAGRDDEAARSGQAWLSLLTPAGATEQRAVSHRDLGLFFHRGGRHEEARRHFTAMLADLDTIGAGYFWAGEYYELTGDLERAREAYRRADQEPTGHSRALAALVKVEEALGNTEQAEQYARTYDTRRQHGFPEAIPLLPGVLARQGRLAEAATLLREAIADAESAGRTASAGALYHELAQLRLLEGDHGAADQAAAVALAAARRTGQAELVIRAAAVGALARAASGATMARRSAHELAQIVASADLAGWPQLRSDIRLAQARAWRLAGEPARALAALDGAARDVDRIAASLTTDPSQAGYRSAQVRISNLALAIALDLGTAGPAAWNRWSHWRKARGLSDTRALQSLASLRAGLAPGAALIDYAVLDSMVAALVVTRDGASLHRLPARADSLAAGVNRFTSMLAPRIGRLLDAGHSRHDTALARSLHAALIAPLAARLDGQAALSIVADGPLHQLPFDALLDGGTLLLARYAIELVPSLAMAGAAQNRAAVSLLVMQGQSDTPVPGAAEEVAALRAHYPSATTLSGRHATEGALATLAPGANIVHLVAHAVASNADPLASRLQLAASADADGVLHADEIEQLALSGSLVVLSACETAAGRLAAGEGVLSLSRAFLRAGASATIATLWPVGEPTARLMDVLYRELAGGAGYARALHAAKLALSRTDPPAAWAPFVLVRRGSPANVTFSSMVR